MQLKQNSVFLTTVKMHNITSFRCSKFFNYQGQHRTLGGNACNNCSVMSQFGLGSVEFFGTFAAEPKHFRDFATREFERKKVWAIQQLLMLDLTMKRAKHL